MIPNTLSTATVYVPAAGPGEPAPPEVAAEPVTAEEVAALARRIRVEARLKGIAVVGTLLGIVCGTATIWPFLDSRGYMAEMIVAGDLAGWGFLASWLLAGLLPLLAFYAGRLQFQSGRSSTDAMETSLRKIRRVILGCMFASMAAFVLVLAQQQSRRVDGASWMAFIHASCFIACAGMIGDVRRGLGDFDSEHQRRRRKLARGFAVELRPVGGPASQDDIPLATRPGPAALSAIPLGEQPPSTADPELPISQPPQLPAVQQPIAVLPALPPTVGDLGEDDHFKDLRLTVTLAIGLAVGIYAVRLGNDLAAALREAEQLLSMFERSLLPATSASESSVNIVLTLLARIAAVLLALCAVLWLVWGILSLNYGPAFRRMVDRLTVITLILAALCLLPAWVYTFGTPAIARDASSMGCSPAPLRSCTPCFSACS